MHKATVAYCDNVFAIYMSSNPIHHKRTKHIELDIHFVQERVQIGELRVLHVPTGEQYANVMTKGLLATTFEAFRSSLCVVPITRQTAGVLRIYAKTDDSITAGAWIGASVRGHLVLHQHASCVD